MFTFWMTDIWKLLIFIIRVASCRMPEKPGINLLCLYLLLCLYHYTSIYMVMGLSGIELILFIACMMLCFEFVTKTVLITHQWFGYFWAEFAQHKGILFFPFCPQQWTGWGCTKSWEEIHDRNRPKGYSKPCNEKMKSFNIYSQIFLVVCLGLFCLTRSFLT